MQRLYIGGLSHTVTSKDLKDRFGKFGDVQDVELRTRRDDEGKETFKKKTLRIHRDKELDPIKYPSKHTTSIWNDKE